MPSFDRTEADSADLGRVLGTVTARYTATSHPVSGWQFTGIEGFEHDLWFESPSPTSFPLSYRVSANRLGRIRQMWNLRDGEEGGYWTWASPTVLDAVPRELLFRQNWTGELPPLHVLGSWQAAQALLRGDGDD